MATRGRLGGVGGNDGESSDHVVKGLSDNGVQIGVVSFLLALSSRVGEDLLFVYHHRSQRLHTRDRSVSDMRRNIRGGDACPETEYSVR
jgi:hypothetical protein